jgi:hypothetical protein
MAAPPPGADVQDGAGPPPQGSPSPEGSLRAPFPAFYARGKPCFPRVPLLLRRGRERGTAGLPAGEAGLRPRATVHGSAVEA